MNITKRSIQLTCRHRTQRATARKENERGGDGCGWKSQFRPQRGPKDRKPKRKATHDGESTGHLHHRSGSWHTSHLTGQQPQRTPSMARCSWHNACMVRFAAHHRTAPRTPLCSRIVPCSGHAAAAVPGLAGPEERRGPRRQQTPWWRWWGGRRLGEGLPLLFTH